MLRNPAQILSRGPSLPPPPKKKKSKAEKLACRCPLPPSPHQPISVEAQNFTPHNYTFLICIKFSICDEVFQQMKASSDRQQRHLFDAIIARYRRKALKTPLIPRGK